MKYQTYVRACTHNFEMEYLASDVIVHTLAPFMDNKSRSNSKSINKHWNTSIPIRESKFHFVSCSPCDGCVEANKQTGCVHINSIWTPFDENFEQCANRFKSDLPPWETAKRKQNVDALFHLDIKTR